MKFFLIFIILVFSAGFISADFFEIGEPSHSIIKSYAPGNPLSGWINISLQKSPVGSLINTSEGDSTKIIDLINENEGYENQCFPLDCESDYSVSDSGDTFKELNLAAYEEKILGFKFDENIDGVTDFEVKIKSDVTESYSPQLYIDILSDGDEEWMPYNSSGNFKEGNQGCFDPDLSTKSAKIDKYNYCGRMNLDLSPNVKIGADITKKEGGVSTFEMKIYSKENPYNEGICKIEDISEGGEIECIPKNDEGFDFRVNKKGDYYVCISEDTGDGGYEIKYEKEDSCGYSEIDDEDLIDFDLFVKSGKFKEIGSFFLNDDELENYGAPYEISNQIDEYLSNKYNKKCSEENSCIAPIKFYSGKNQNINLSDINVEFITSVSTSTDKIYEIEENTAKVSSDFQKLYLNESDFSLPEDFGAHNISLYFEGSTIFEDETIFIEKIPQVISISPTTVHASYPIEFSVNVDTFGSKDSLTYFWEFGDNSSKETSKNKTKHTYNETGTYSLKVSIENPRGVGSSKTFEINAKTPKKATGSLLELKTQSLNDITIQINKLDSFQKERLKEQIDLDGIQTELGDLQKKHKTAASEQDYINLMADLLNVKVPSSIVKSNEISSLTFIPSEEDIDLDILKEIGGGDYDSNYSEEYLASIISWHLENIESKITFEKYTAGYENHVEDILSFFEISIDDNDNREDSYFILYGLEDVYFKNDVEEEDGNQYIEIEDDSEEIVFSTSENILLEDLSAFISPSLDQISDDFIEGKGNNNSSKFADFEGSKWILFGLILGLIILMGIIAYIIIGKWYQKKYEDYLFKNKNELYNLVNYVHSAKKKGISNKEIEKNLRKVKWSSEQVSYILKKYAGKEIGLPGVKDKFKKK